MYLFVKAAAVLLVKVRANRFVESCEGQGVKENGLLSCMLQIENSIYAMVLQLINATALVEVVVVLYFCIQLSLFMKIKCFHSHKLYDSL